MKAVFVKNHKYNSKKAKRRYIFYNYTENKISFGDWYFPVSNDIDIKILIKTYPEAVFSFHSPSQFPSSLYVVNYDFFNMVVCDEEPPLWDDEEDFRKIFHPWSGEVDEDFFDAKPKELLSILHWKGLKLSGVAKFLNLNTKILSISKKVNDFYFKVKREEGIRFRNQEEKEEKRKEIEKWFEENKKSLPLSYTQIIEDDIVKIIIHWGREDSPPEIVVHTEEHGLGVWVGEGHIVSSYWWEAGFYYKIECVDYKWKMKVASWVKEKYNEKIEKTNLKKKKGGVR